MSSCTAERDKDLKLLEASADTGGKRIIPKGIDADDEDDDDLSDEDSDDEVCRSCAIEYCQRPELQLSCSC